jgi:hypothetical protein
VHWVVSFSCGAQYMHLRRLLFIGGHTTCRRCRCIRTKIRLRFLSIFISSLSCSTVMRSEMTHFLPASSQPTPKQSDVLPWHSGSSFDIIKHIFSDTFSFTYFPQAPGRSGKGGHARSQSHWLRAETGR